MFGFPKWGIENNIDVIVSSGHAEAAWEAGKLTKQSPVIYALIVFEFFFFFKCVNINQDWIEFCFSTFIRSALHGSN